MESIVDFPDLFEGLSRLKRSNFRLSDCCDETALMWTPKCVQRPAEGKPVRVSLRMFTWQVAECCVPQKKTNKQKTFRVCATSILSTSPTINVVVTIGQFHACSIRISGSALPRPHHILLFRNPADHQWNILCVNILLTVDKIKVERLPLSSVILQRFARKLPRFPIWKDHNARSVPFLLRRRFNASVLEGAAYSLEGDT